MLIDTRAGTNLVAMEAMMSGVPCIITNCTGHVDLLNIDPPPSFFHDRLSEPSDADTESGGTSEDGLDATVDHSGNSRHSNTAGARTHAHPYAFVIGGDDLSPELCMHQNIGKAERRQFLQERKEGRCTYSYWHLYPCTSLVSSVFIFTYNDYIAIPIHR